MATRYNPRLILTVDGQPVATGGAADLLAVDKLTMTWGRKRVWEHQESAQAAMTLLDRTAVYGSNTGPTLLGKTVLLSYDVPGVLAERVFFRGKVTDVAVTVLPPDPATGANRGILLEVTAASIVTSLANARTGTVSWGSNTFSTRWALLRAIIWPSLVTAAAYNTAATDVFGNTLNWGTRQVAARDYQNESVVGALKEMLDFTSDRMVYDPHTNALGVAARKIIDSSLGFAQLVPGAAADDDGAVLKLPGHGTMPMLRGSEFTTAGLQRSVETSLTAVETSRWSDSTGATASPGGVLYLDQATDAANPNRMTVRTDWYSSTDSAQTLAVWVSMMVREARAWIPDPITHLTKRAGGLTLGQIPLLLSGTEPAGLVYLGGTDWARAGIAPAFSIIGGRIDYVGGDPGWWSPTVQLSGIYFRNASASTFYARSPANCDTATVPLRAVDLSDSVSAADAAFWTAAYSG